MSSRRYTENGYIEISDSLVARIASTSATSTYGVVGLAAKNPKDGLYKLLSVENKFLGVNVFSNETDTLSLEISVIIENGTRVSTVAANLIDGIRFAVEYATGLVVENVHVVIRGINM